MKWYCALSILVNIIIIGFGTYLLFLMRWRAYLEDYLKGRDKK